LYKKNGRLLVLRLIFGVSLYYLSNQNTGDKIMSNFWVPKFKWQYVEWFVKQGILTKNQANTMKLNNLRGKYFEIRSKE
jgi:hypothetical protein